MKKNRYLLFMLFLSFCLVGISQEETLNVWGKIKIVTPNYNLPAGLIPDMQIRLEGDNYSKILSPNELESMQATGRFAFTNVPFGKYRFTISYKSVDGQINKWSGSFKFKKPDLNIVQENLNKKRAYKIAGFLGKFYCPVKSGKIEVENKYID